MPKPASVTSPTVSLSNKQISTALDNFCKEIGFAQPGKEIEQALLVFILLRNSIARVMEDDWDNILKASEEGRLCDINGILGHYMIDAMANSAGSEIKAFQ